MEDTGKNIYKGLKVTLVNLIENRQNHYPILHVASLQTISNINKISSDCQAYKELFSGHVTFH